MEGEVEALRHGLPAGPRPPYDRLFRLLRQRAALPPRATHRTHAAEIPDSRGGTVRFEVRRPVDERAAVPVLIILAGIKTGHQTLSRLPECGANALVAYAYPYDRARWQRRSAAGRGLVAWRMAHRVSDQIAALLEWVKRQPWCDAGRVSIGGASLGAIVLPMILREIQSRGLGVCAAVFACGGAGRTALAYLSLRRRSFPLAATGAVLAFLCLRRLEPARHLPRVEGAFLVISSLDDELVPRRCAARFEALLPQPKQILHLRGEHPDSHRPELLASVVEATRDWLVARGAFNP